MDLAATAHWTGAVKPAVNTVSGVAGATGVSGPAATLESVSTPPTPSLEPITNPTQYRQVAEFCQRAAKAYYLTDTVLCDDATYDKLMANLAEAEAAHPEWASEGAVSAKVAAGAVSGEYRHVVPMLSLDNTFDEESLTAFVNKVTAVGGGDTLFSVEPKLDGLAISAQYENGRLVRLVTRGDGQYGEVVSHVLGRDPIQGLPDMVGEDRDIEVRGEMIMTSEDFAAANEARVRNGDTPFANPRNAVAGSVRAQDRSYSLPLTFIGYDLVQSGDAGSPAGEQATHSENMRWLVDQGVQTAASVHLDDGETALVTCGPDGVAAAVARIEELRSSLGFLVDGAVIKTEDPEVRRKLGSGSRAPRWATAYKYAAEMALTRLEEIDVSVGRTGRLTPVAVLAPVSVGGVTVSSATLNNFEDISRKDVRVGDMVWVRRAGDVIPEVVGPELSQRPEGTDSYTPPETCPRCGGPLDTTEVVWRCAGEGCGLPAGILYFASRKAMDIDGLGNHAVSALLDAGLVSDIADLYQLTTGDVARLERFGQASAQNLVDAIEASKDAGLERVLTSLGIRHLGRRLSGRLVKEYPSMDQLLAAVTSHGGEALREVEGFGAVKAEIVAAGLKDSEPLIRRLEAAGVRMTADEDTASASSGGLEGLKVLVTGSVPGHTRDTAKHAVETAGGTAVSSVSSKTDLLLAGEGAGGSKLAKAESLGIQVVDVSAEGEFDRICREGL